MYIYYFHAVIIFLILIIYLLAYSRPLLMRDLKLIFILHIVIVIKPDGMDSKHGAVIIVDGV